MGPPSRFIDDLKNRMPMIRTGEDANIASWAEASLVARWFDNTPTSALDISFNETLPTA